MLARIFVMVVAGVIIVYVVRWIDKNVWTDAKCAAFRVEFLTSREELFLYAKAIYSAIMWSREVNEKNRIIMKKINL